MTENIGDIEQPWGDHRIKMNGCYIGCDSTENAKQIIQMQEENRRMREEINSLKLALAVHEAMGNTSGTRRSGCIDAL